MSSRTEELRERLFAKAAIAAESSDPTARAIGRLLASEITDAMSDFLDKEQASNSNPLDVMGAVTWYTATILSAYLISAPDRTRRVLLDALASSMRDFALDMIKTAEAGHGK